MVDKAAREVVDNLLASTVKSVVSFQEGKGDLAGPGAWQGNVEVWREGNIDCCGYVVDDHDASNG